MTYHEIYTYISQHQTYQWDDEVVDEKYKQDKRNETKQEQENDNLALRAALKLGMKFVLLPTMHTFRILFGCEKNQSSKQNMMSQQEK